MALAADLSARLGMLARSDAGRVTSLLARAGLPVAVKGLATNRFRELMSVDKKAKDGRLRFILLQGIGSASIRGDVPELSVKQTLEAAAGGA